MRRDGARFGQNFLIDRGVIRRIIEAVQPTREELILEIGPGSGALTSRLVETAGHVIAIELDRRLLPHLTRTFVGVRNLTLLEDDALSAKFCDIIYPTRSARVVANLPYNVATAILQRLIDHRRCLTEFVLVIQSEMATRISATPGSKSRSFISVFVEAYCQISSLFEVHPNASSPRPKVWSSVVRVTPRQSPLVGTSESVLWEVVKAGFAHRRKTMLNNLRGAPPSL